MQIENRITTKFTLRFEIPLLEVKKTIKMDGDAKVKSLLKFLDINSLEFESAYRRLFESSKISTANSVGLIVKLKNNIINCKIEVEITKNQDND